MRSHTHTHTHTRTPTHMHAHTHTHTYIYIYIYIERERDNWKYVLVLRVCIITNPSARAGYDTRSIFKQRLTGLNSEFSFSYTVCLTEEPSLPYYLPIAGWRIFGFIPFPMVLVLCEMQSVSSRIWTRVAVSISYDVCVCMFVCMHVYVNDKMINEVQIRKDLKEIYKTTEANWYRSVDMSISFSCIINHQALINRRFYSLF